MDLHIVHVQYHVAVIGHAAFAIDRIAAQPDNRPSDVAARHGDDFDRQRELAQSVDQLALVGYADEGMGHGGDDLHASVRRRRP